MSAMTVVIVTGLSGGGKSSVLRALEDVGYEAVDNPPVPMLEEMIARQAGRLRVMGAPTENDLRTLSPDDARQLASPAAGGRH